MISFLPFHKINHMFAGDFTAPGALRRRISPPAGGELLCPWRLVVAKSACLRFRLTAKTATAPLLLLFPANPLRWASPGVRERLTKTPPGTAPDEHFVLIVAFPRTPLRGTRTSKVAQNFRRAKSEWLSAISSGPLRRRGFRIPRFVLTDKARSLHRSSSPTQTHFAGLCVGGRLRRPD